MYKFKNKCIKDCPHVLKSVFNRQYVDDIFVMFSLNHAEKFKKYLSSKHLNINFLLEKENDGSVSFSNVNIFHKKGKHVTNFYQIKNFSSVSTNFNCFIPETNKTSLIKAMFRCFSLCLDFVKFHYEINILKDIWYINNYTRMLRALVFLRVMGLSCEFLSDRGYLKNLETNMGRPVNF